MDINVLGFPVPDKAFLALVLVGATTQIARALTERLDEDILEAPEVRGLNATLYGATRRLLNATHHWWIGGLLAYYNWVGYTLSLGPLNYASAGSFEWMCIGFGLMLDDYDDMPGRLRETLATLKDSIKGTQKTPTLSSDEAAAIIRAAAQAAATLPATQQAAQAAAQPTFTASAELKTADGGRIA